MARRRRRDTARVGPNPTTRRCSETWRHTPANQVESVPNRLQECVTPTYPYGMLHFGTGIQFQRIPQP